MFVEKNPFDDVIDYAVRDFRAETTVGPSPKLVARTLARLKNEEENQVAALTVSASPSRRRRWIGTACLVSSMAAAISWLIFAGASSQSFAQVVETIRQTVGLAVDADFRLGSNSVQHCRMQLTGRTVRIDYPEIKLVGIGDLDSKEVLFLDHANRLAQRRAMSESQFDELAHAIGQLRNAHVGDAEFLGTETIDGKPRQLFRLRQAKILGMTGIPEMLVWIDPTTHLPTRLVLKDRDPKSEMEIAFHNFDWNVAPDPTLFAFAIPDGYGQGNFFPEPVGPAPPLQATPAGPETRLISGDRVPCALAWSNDSQSLTAIMTNQEGAAPHYSPSELRQWDVASARLRWQIAIEGCRSLASTTDGATLVTAIGREIQIRSAIDGAVVSTLKAKSVLPALALSGDGAYLVSGIADWDALKRSRTPAGGVELWDTHTGRLVHALEADGITSEVAVSKDGRWIAGENRTNSGGGVNLWRASDGELVHAFAASICFTFSPDSRLLAMSKYAGKAEAAEARIQVIEVGTWKVVKDFSVPKYGWFTELSFSPDSQWLAGGTWEGDLYRWSFESGGEPIEVRQLGGGIHRIAFSPDGKSMATGSEDGALQIWPLEPK